jgi:hypothetical protein
VGPGGVAVAGLLDGVAGADELAAVRCEGLVDAGTLELGVLGPSVAVLEAARGVEATGVAECLADEHPALSSTVAPSTSTSRRCRGGPGCVGVLVRDELTIMRRTLVH